MTAVRLGEASGRWVHRSPRCSAPAWRCSTPPWSTSRCPRSAKTSAPASTACSWTLNGYTLTLASFILLGGSLGDRFGRRRIFVIGTVWFALASLLCGAGAHRRAPGGGARAAGRRRRAAHARQPGDDRRPVRGGGARPRHRPVVRAGRARQRDRALRRRLAHRHGRLALGVPDQPADRRRRRLRRAAPRAGDLGSGGRKRLDLAGAALGASAWPGVTFALVQAGESGCRRRVVARRRRRRRRAGRASSWSSGARATRCCRSASSPPASSPRPTRSPSWSTRRWGGCSSCSSCTCRSSAGISPLAAGSALLADHRAPAAPVRAGRRAVGAHRPARCRCPPGPRSAPPACCSCCASARTPSYLTDVLPAVVRLRARPSPHRRAAHRDRPGRRRRRASPASLPASTTRWRAPPACSRSRCCRWPPA